LIDADILAYQIASACQKAVEWQPDLWCVWGDLREAKPAIDERLSSLMSLLKADHMILALTDSAENWRKQVLPTYKSNRKKVVKPFLLKPLREYLTETYDTFQRPTLEGDDVLGILSTSEVIVSGEKVVVSLDKDLKTIPGLLYNDGKRKRYNISTEEADYWHMYQTLIGDTTDGYKGCPGIGPVAAKRLLDPIKEGGWSTAVAWEKIVETYKKKGLGIQEALRQAQVARICRTSEYDFKKKKVIPWTPPN
jgi:DNA polymerase-1